MPSPDFFYRFTPMPLERIHSELLKSFKKNRRDVLTYLSESNVKNLTSLSINANRVKKLLSHGYSYLEILLVFDNENKVLYYRNKGRTRNEK